jgi:hypothetical protein
MSAVASTQRTLSFSPRNAEKRENMEQGVSHVMNFRS